MPTYRLKLTAAVDSGRLDAFLKAKGYVLTDGSSVGLDGYVTILSDRDPSPDLINYLDAPSPSDLALTQAVGRLKVYASATRLIPATSRTPEQSALLDVLTVLRASLT
jgi:hypothetical protein